MVNKRKLIDELIRNQKIKINEIEDRIKLAAEATDLDESDTLDQEDFSHQNEANDLKLFFEHQLKDAVQELQHLILIDPSLKESITSGAIVGCENFNIFIGISFPPFLFEKKKIIGISLNTPIFKEMQEKTVGEYFRIAVNDYFIQSIQ
jgi:hypothetical protein